MDENPATPWQLANGPAALKSALSGQADGIILDIRDLSISFGGVRALDGFSMLVRRGEITGLIGPNGAGKTTVLNCIAGHYRPTTGSILLNGESLLDIAAHRIVERGVARTFQNIALINALSVADNVRVGGHAFVPTGIMGALLRLPTTRRQERTLTAQVHKALAALELEPLAERCPNDLATGLRKKVELARALVTEPPLLLLDEPAAGLSYEEIDWLANFIQSLRSDGTTVVLIEHHMGLVRKVCDRVVALDFGHKIAEGSTEEALASSELAQAYLGSARS